MFTIEAEVRNVQGKGASRRLRTANKFPAIVYTYFCFDSEH